MKMQLVIPFLTALIFAVLTSPAFGEMSILEEELLHDPLYHEMLLYEDELEMPDDTVEMTEEMDAIEETEQVAATEPIFSAEFVSLSISCSDTATAE